MAIETQQKIRPKINFITIAVEDLRRSVAFYQEGLGLPTKGIEQDNEDHCLFELENDFSLVLYRRREFLPLTANPDASENSAGFIISHITNSGEEVDEILARAQKAGGKACGKIQDEPWGYSANFTDPDGHQWEIIYMPHY